MRDWLTDTNSPCDFETAVVARSAEREPGSVAFGARAKAQKLKSFRVVASLLQPRVSAIEEECGMGLAPGITLSAMCTPKVLATPTSGFDHGAPGSPKATVNSHSPATVAGSNISLVDLKDLRNVRN